MGRLGGLGGPGGFLERLGCLGGASWGLLGACWGHLGGLLEASCVNDNELDELFVLELQDPLERSVSLRPRLKSHTAVEIRETPDRIWNTSDNLLSLIAQKGIP